MVGVVPGMTQSNPVLATYPRPSFAKPFPTFASRKIKGGGAPVGATVPWGHATHRMSPPKCASGAAARPAGRARLSALHRGSRRGFDPSAQLRARFPGTWFRRALPALSCPSPVAAPHAPVVMPADMMPEAARVRSVSFRPRAPLPLHFRKHPREGVPGERDRFAYY
jgi:hypothetical protein